MGEFCQKSAPIAEVKAKAQVNPNPPRLCHNICYQGDKKYPSLGGVKLMYTGGARASIFGPFALIGMSYESEKNAHL